jgi:hypothetical protein
MDLVNQSVRLTWRHCQPPRLRATIVSTSMTTTRTTRRWRSAASPRRSLSVRRSGQRPGMVRVIPGGLNESTIGVYSTLNSPSISRKLCAMPFVPSPTWQMYPYLSFA